MQNILVDAGPLIALFSFQDRHHAHYDNLVHELSTDGLRLLSTWPCIVEASYLLNDSSRFALLEWVSLGGVTVYPFGADDLGEMIPVMKRYTESGKRVMDLADVSLFWIAMQTGIRIIMTVDRRDFTRYRLPGGEAFNLL